jgi:hypothetical protein
MLDPQAFLPDDQAAAAEAEVRQATAERHRPVSTVARGGRSILVHPDELGRRVASCVWVALRFGGPVALGLGVALLGRALSPP